MALPSLAHPVEHEGEVAGGRPGELDVPGELAGGVGEVYDACRRASGLGPGRGPAAERAVAEPEVQRGADHDHQVGLRRTPATGPG